MIYLARMYRDTGVKTVILCNHLITNVTCEEDQYTTQLTSPCMARHFSGGADSDTVCISQIGL